MADIQSTTGRGRPKIHGHAATTGRRQTVEYDTWSAMIRRCHDPNTPQFPNYGGRGIVVCDEWRHDFQAFLDYVGLRPCSKDSLDRIDVDGNYKPGNVRWATWREQRRNTRQPWRDLSGQRFGAYFVVKYIGNRPSRNGKPTGPFWHCRCDCGTEKLIRGDHLRHGKARSCGCMRAHDERGRWTAIR